MGFTPDGRPIHRYKLGQYRQAHLIMLFEMAAQLPWECLLREPDPDDGWEFRKLFEKAEEIEIFSGMSELSEDDAIAELIPDNFKSVFDECKIPRIG